jgi:hypothetical protein
LFTSCILVCTGEFEQLESARQDDDAEEARSRKAAAMALEGLPDGETVASLVERVARLNADLESERRKQSAMTAAQGEATAGESMLRVELDLAEKVPIFVTERAEPISKPYPPPPPTPLYCFKAKREREVELVASRKEVAELVCALDAAKAEAEVSERRAGDAAAKAQRQAAEAARVAALSSQAAESADAREVVPGSTDTDTDTSSAHIIACSWLDLTTPLHQY